MTPTTGFELETEFTLTAPNWNGDGNLHYTYVAESTEDGVTRATILGHGQKKTNPNSYPNPNPNPNPHPHPHPNPQPN